MCLLFNNLWELTSPACGIGYLGDGVTRAVLFRIKWASWSNTAVPGTTSSYRFSECACSVNPTVMRAGEGNAPSIMLVELEEDSNKVACLCERLWKTVSTLLHFWWTGWTSSHMSTKSLHSILQSLDIKMLMDFQEFQVLEFPICPQALSSPFEHYSIWHRLWRYTICIDKVHDIREASSSKHCVLRIDEVMETRVQIHIVYLQQYFAFSNSRGTLDLLSSSLYYDYDY